MKYKLKPLVGRLLLLSAFGFTFLGCNNEDDNPQNTSNFIWQQLGLEGLKVNQLVLENNLLYAATENGVYKKQVASNEEFDEIGLQGKNVETILVFSDQEILASVVDFQTDIEIEIYKTATAGNAWEVFESNFGGGFESSGLWAFHKHPVQENLLYATGNYLVAKSTDKGVSWEPIFGDWDQFARATAVVAVNPFMDDEIWLGGQGGLEDGYLVRLKEEVEVDRWLDLVDNPTTAQKIVFDAENPQSIYVGFEGALLKTNTNGESWITLIDAINTSRFFNGIALSNLNKNMVFAGGWLKGGEPQPLILYYSMDKGATWQEEIFTDEAYGGIEDMLLVTEGDKERIFIALDKGGVYEVVYSPN
jgi:hypothetical protein